MSTTAAEPEGQAEAIEALQELEASETLDIPAEINREDYQALARFRYTLRRFLHFTEEGARQAGLTPQQHQVLLAIKGHPEREWANVSELAEAMQLRHHAAVGLVDRCEIAGLVRRDPDPDDRRQVRVSLTEKGEAILARLSRRNMTELRMLRQALHLSLDELSRAGVV